MSAASLPFLNPDASQLFGHPIIRGGKLSLADQIYDVICEEIHAGRWAIGERLPSLATIAAGCGVSRMPVQLAVERLAEKGYVRLKGRSGAFLQSIMPHGRTPIGAVGIVVLSDAKLERDMENLAFEQYLVHRFIEAADLKNYQVRVHYVRKSDDCTKINQRGKVFDVSVKGIVSLAPFPRASASKLAANEIPLIFWCEPDHTCGPCVASDYAMAFYEATRKAIACGHTRIAPVASPGNSPLLTQRYMFGYLRAMQEAGLSPMEEYMAPSEAISLQDALGIKGLLSRSPRATAFLCMSLERSEQLISTALLMGLSVPRDFSIIGPNPPSSPLLGGIRLTGIGFSPEAEIEMCFDLLRGQALSKAWNVGTVLMAPLFVEGDTLAPPPSL